MDLREETVLKAMKKINDVYKLSTETIFDRKLINEIKDSGYSNIPIYKKNSKDNIVGVIKARWFLTAK